MIKKITVGILSLLVAALFTNLSFAFEPAQLGYTVQQAELNNLPSTVSNVVSSYYHLDAGTLPVDPREAEAEIRNILLRLEAEGVDSRQLAKQMPLSVYTLSGSFGLYSAFTIWFSSDNTDNSIVLGGERESELQAGTYKQNLAHEWGHAVSNRYFTEDMKATYRKMRGIPNAWLHSNVWEENPDEIFAEDFAYLFGSHDPYYNKSAEATLKPEEAKTLKGWIISILLHEQKPITFLSKEDESLYLLRQQGVIPSDAFTLTELTTFAKAPVANGEMIIWLYNQSMEHVESNSFFEVIHRKQLYVELSKKYSAQTSSWNTIEAIYRAFAPFDGWKDVTTPQISGHALSRGEVAAWAISSS